MQLSQLPLSLGSCAKVFLLNHTAAKFWMISLGSKTLRTLKVAAIRYMATVRSCDIVDLSWSVTAAEVPPAVTKVSLCWKGSEVN